MRGPPKGARKPVIRAPLRTGAPHHNGMVTHPIVVMELPDGRVINVIVVIFFLMFLRLAVENVCKKKKLIQII